MKAIKRVFIILLIVIFVLPIVFYVGVVVANNHLADRIEKDLIAYELPKNTQLIDSISIAGKLTGNGNGMQYMGSVLVVSDLSEEELKTHYSSCFEYVEVRKQQTEQIDFINSNNYSFTDFVKSDEKQYYSITCWDIDRQEIYGEFISELLDVDIRGH